ncbi:ATP-dependent DNA helicase RecG [Kordiimonas sp. SCSIO 12603]|uniref:ATP-dependent DNA helicase RecG n=1 Tax=Kordiimonas sp. SCSIO 12603 TaxID=2829596 RepID=UPI002104E382|nr:ATP-dependent DNA helicase RecG [Kordiimonas sp. SCSIO 12603]UTW57751.1 ATP-dependent DNA helicase RecG [Kordiimonas sp. SCSIO 12603]
MRPALLNEYFADIERLPGIGPRSKLAFERLAGGRTVDLLFHMPSGLVDRQYRPKVAEAAPGSLVTLEVTVHEHRPGPNRRVPYRVVCSDDTAELTLVFFNPRADWLKKQLPEGEKRIISGKLEHYNGKAQITHPDYMVDPSSPEDMPLLETIYPLTAGVSGKVLRKAIAGAVASVPELPEWHDESLMKREDWPDFMTALERMHKPEHADDLEPSSDFKRRLAADELLATQLALAIVRERTRKKRGRVLKGDGSIRKKLFEVLPYELTGDQQKALSEIIHDLESERAMLRLVQGDVGSGKTVVALLAMAAATEAGVQSAILAPTEILANQHLETISEFADKVGLKIALLTGRVKGKPRKALLEALANGEIDILIGTHAIIQDDVVFKDLGLAIIDEQHRFGVQQRLALAAKAERGVDVLGMTATPIPRTLTLTAYGDMDTSLIREKPPGRLPVDTRVVSLDRIGDVAAGIQRAVASGARAYWVCPLVEESEQLDLAAAEDRFESLKQMFGERVGLVHGKMKGAEKDEVMGRFQRGELRVLVSTTVIEVGVNVPEATIMVIEHAERFGLAQLHQLRGRVGRGSGKSSCILLRTNQIGEVASSRLRIMRETEDGFLIAEEDLKLRGGGEILGTKQSGLPEFKMVDFTEHADLIELARDDARLIINKDPELKGKRSDALRHLLYLFERDEGVRLMGSG